MTSQKKSTSSDPPHFNWNSEGSRKS